MDGGSKRCYSAVMDAPKIFLSYARADRGIAERLRTSLEKQGCVVHDPATNGALVGPRISVPYEDLKGAAQRADQLVLLFGKHRDRDVMQEQEWQAALEASWDDASKKMIPVLLGNAELPNFIRGAAGTGRSALGLHVNGLREAERAAEIIARTVHGKSAEKSGDYDVPIEQDAAGGQSAHSQDEPDAYAYKRGYSLGIEEDDGESDFPVTYDGSDGYPVRGGSRKIQEVPKADDYGLTFAVEPPSRKEIAARFAAIRRYVEELKS